MSSCDTNLVSGRRLGQPRFGDPMRRKDLGQTTLASRVWTVLGCPELDGSGGVSELIALKINQLIDYFGVKINTEKIFNCINL